MRISRSTARQLALARQGLDGRWRPASGKEGVLQTIERLGYVQIDTISVVQRAHHHVLWSRCPDYDPEMLHELLARERRVFEWWAHAASYIPMRDYRYYLPRMRAAAQRERTRQWVEDHGDVVQDVLDRIRAEGPLGSSDFPAPEGFKRGTWWSWKPAKRALEALFSSGELMVSERRNFQRIYDLRERVLPAGFDLTEPDPDQVERFVIRRALGGLGIIADRDLHRGRHRVRGEVLQGLVEAGEVVALEIADIEDRTFYALREALEEAADPRADGKLIHILSPFDNLVIRRRWLSEMFDFSYKLEAYTPAAERRYGYFTLPILWGERFVGRVDCKADRKAHVLIVRRLTLEPGFTDVGALLPPLSARLWEFCRFNGCAQVVLEGTEPPAVQAPLAQSLADAGPPPS